SARMRLSLYGRNPDAGTEHARLSLRPFPSDMLERQASIIVHLSRNRQGFARTRTRSRETSGMHRLKSHDFSYITMETTMRTRMTLAAAMVAVGALLGWLAASGELAMIAQGQNKTAETQPPGGSDVLPRPEQPFKGKIGRTAKESTPDFPK